MATTRKDKFFTSLENPKFRQAKNQGLYFNVQVQDIRKGDVIRIKNEFFARKLGEKKYVRYLVTKKYKNKFDVCEIKDKWQDKLGSKEGLGLELGAYYWVEKW
jgi:hypothetical protein